MDTQANMSSVKCLSVRNDSERAPSSPAGVSTALASVLIFTIVVDIVGNVLVILSVFRNKKRRNAGKLESLITFRTQTVYCMKHQDNLDWIVVFTTAHICKELDMSTWPRCLTSLNTGP